MGLRQRWGVKMNAFRQLTDHEAKDTDPSTGALDHGLIKCCSQLRAEFGTEGDHAKQHEEDGREDESDANESGGGSGGRR